MPLVRYELRCEHSLANPELFRSAARDDPEGLLEGVAMAGLVGIVRQLGDLAEFAAEVFRDLHEEFVSVGGRAHDLTVRVQQLEAELPAVEKALLSEPNQLRFAYTNGADWHASIRSDQNHCTSGELPRFVRNFYQECRGPPRLFLLDKFDVAGAGACLKRYSDPSFFKLEWASSELMKAQRAQRDKKARRDKKKGRRRKTGEPIAAINQIPARVRYGSASLEDLDSLSHLLAPTLKNEVGSSSSNQGVRNGLGTQTPRRSNLGPPNKMIGGPSSPTGVSPAQAEGGAPESLKISAKDIEANVSGKFYQPSETENVAESMAGKISKIIEMEDRDAMPPVGLLPRNVDNKSPKRADELIISESDVEAKETNRVAREGPKAAVMGRTGNTSPRGISRGNASMAGREGSNLGNSRVSQSSVPDVPSKGSATLDAKEDVNSSDLRTPSSSVPDDAGFAGSQEDPSRTSSIGVRDLGQFSGKVSRRNAVDAKEAHVIAARFPRQNSGRTSRGINGKVTDASEHISGVGSLTKQFSGAHEAQDRHEDSHHSHGAHRYEFAPTGNPLQSLPNHKNLTHVSDTGHGVDDQPKHSINEAPAGDGSAPTTADKSEGSLLSTSKGEPAIHDVRLSESQRPANNAVDTSEVSRNLEETVKNPPSLPPVRIKEILANEEESLMISATSPKVSSQCSSPGGDDIRPSTSMLSRLSYSSELMPLSSDSELDSPVSPNSPAFNALYSPPGSPSRLLGAMIESPTGIYMESYSRTTDRSGFSSSRSEIPVLCLSPRSQLASPSAVSWAAQAGHAAPLRPPPPLPIVISIPENSSHFDSRKEFTSLESQPFHLPSPSLDPELDLPTSSEADDKPAQSNEEPRHLTGSQENAGTVRAEPAGGSPDNPDLLHSGVHSEVPSEHTEQIQSPVANMEAEVLSPSTSSTPAVTEPVGSSLPSSFDYSDSAIIQPSYQSLVNFDPQQSTESRSVDVPSDGPTSNIDSLPTPVGEFEAYPPSEPLQGPPPYPASSGVSVQHTPSSPGQAINTAPSSISVEDEESEPSSPTGSVIIKDTPSPPGSPASTYSESEPEIHEYHPSHGQAKSPVSPRSITHALEDVINHRETSSGDISVHEDLTFESSESGPTTAVSVQETGLVNSVSENAVQAACIAPEDRVEAFASHTSSHLGIAHEEKSLQASPVTSPRLELGPTSPLHSLEATTVRSIPVTTSDLKLQKSSPSNSPPDTPPGKEYIAGEDEALTLQWTGRSQPESPSKTEIRVPSGRSASNSPPTSPPKFLDHAGSLRWRGRSDPASLQPDFSLPPNLVCRSETSSPPCSPPPPSDLESPKQWDEVSEVSTSSDSSGTTERTRKEAANVEVYRLPDSPLPPDSPTMSEEGGPSSRRVSDEEGDIAPHQEHEMAETATGRSDSQLPSNSSSEKLSSEALSSGLKVSYDCDQPNETQFRPSTFESSTECVVLDSLPQVDSSQESTFESPTNLNHTNGVHEAPPLPPAPGSTETPTQDALAAAIAHHDWNMMKALSFQDPDHRQFPSPGGRSILLEEIDRKDPGIRPAANINVAAILEKANAIRQAFVGSDGEGDDEDDWSDS